MTKNKPGKYDCYKKAEPDEPMFILLARDPLAPILVNLWAQLQKTREGWDLAKTKEAEACAHAMRTWKQERR